MTYREMPDVLGAEERESAAIQAYGAWRDRTHSIFLATFAIGALVPAAIGYWLVQDAQFHLNNGVASIRINILVGVVLPWLAAVIAGRRIGRAVVRARTHAKLTTLAADYDVPIERLQATTDLVRGL
jgi:hypothetical protein